MGRQKREWYPGACYHVMGRGIRVYFLTNTVVFHIIITKKGVNTLFTETGG